jgi:hypothetical protein
VLEKGASDRGVARIVPRPLSLPNVRALLHHPKNPIVVGPSRIIAASVCPPQRALFCDLRILIRGI